MKKTKAEAILLLSMMLLSFPIILVKAQSQPHNADSMWIDPSSTVFDTTNASVGTRFNVTAWLNMTEDIYSYQIGLHYNRTLLQCTRSGFTAGATSNYCAGHTTVAAGPTIDTSALGNGSVEAGESLLGSDIIPGPKSGSLIWVEFQVLMVPSSGNFSSKFDITTEYPGNTFVLDTNLNNINIVTYDGTYLLIGPTPVGPPPLSASISSNATSIILGQSVLFTSTVSGGSPPYATYQWYVNSTSFPGATSNSWTYMPNAVGSDTVYLNVTDSKPTTAESNSITVQVSSTPPPSGATIYVDPSQIINFSLIPLSTFAINITLASVSNLANCSFNLTYDPQILNWITTQILEVQGQFPTVLSTTGPGSVWANLEYSPSISADPPQPLVTIYFEVKAFGTSALNLTDTSLLDSNGTPIAHSESDGLFSNGKVDVAVTNVVPDLNFLTQGTKDNINITVANLGSISETFNVSALYNTTLIGTITVMNLSNNTQTTLSITWDTTGVPAGNYTITGTASILPFEVNTTNNVYTDGTVQVVTLIHDIALTNITPVRNWTYQGFALPINITTDDDGNFTETFNVTVYADNTTIGMFTVNLNPKNSNTTTFEWNTTSAMLYHNYTLSALANPVPQEFNTTNNFLIDGIVSVRLVGDINGDGKVNIEDISIAAKAFGTFGPGFLFPGSPPSPNWNPDADINGDNKIDVRDILLIANNFGKIYA